MDSAPIRVFISYSHDSPEYAERVLGLAQRLRGDGIDARLDRFEVSPPMGWARWMIDEIEAAARVIMVCTPTYRRRCEGREAAGVGKGASFEGLVLIQHLYDHGGNNEGRKLVPVYFADAGLRDPLDAITPPLRQLSRYALDGEYEALRRDILGIAAVAPAPLGVAEVRSAGVDEVSMTPKDALYNLLLSLFSAEELRGWISRHGEFGVINHDLPGAIASPNKLVGDVAEALDRHGLVDASLFEGLRAQRPRRAEEIGRVEVLWKNRPATSRARAGQAGAHAQGQGQSQPAPSTTVVYNNNNQGGGFNAQGATFNIKGNFIQGDKNEVHHHGPTAAPRLRLPRGASVELSPLRPPSGVDEFWPAAQSESDGPHADVVDDLGDALVLRMRSLAYGRRVLGIQGDLQIEEDGRTPDGVQIRISAGDVGAVTPSVDGASFDVRLTRSLCFHEVSRRWKLQ